MSIRVRDRTPFHQHCILTCVVEVIASNAFRIVSSAKSFNVLTNSRKEKLEWVNAFRAGVFTQKRRHQDRIQQVLKGESRTLEDADYCRLCLKQFSVVRRKTKCGICQYKVCQGCTADSDKKTTRCSACYASST